MPSPLAAVQDRLPAVLERAEATLTDTSGDHLARSPTVWTGATGSSATIETRHPGESAAAIERGLAGVFHDDHRRRWHRSRMTSTAWRGPKGRWSSSPTRRARPSHDADLPWLDAGLARDALDRTSLAADDFRRSLAGDSGCARADARTRSPDRRTAGVGGLRSAPDTGASRNDAPSRRRRRRSLGLLACAGGSGLPAETSRCDHCPNDRASTD